MQEDLKNSNVVNTNKKNIAFVILPIISILLVVLVGILGYYKFNKQIKKPDKRINTTKSNGPVITADKIYGECKDKTYRWGCYSSQLTSLVRDENLKYAYNTLRNLQVKDDQLRYCHAIAHSMSAQEVYKNPNQWASVLADIDINACDYGFLHGVVEGKTKFDKNFKIDKYTSQAICANIQVSGTTEDIERFKSIQCAHIMGHVLLVQEDGDISKAIDVCKTFSESWQSECFFGAFMENNQSESLVLHGISPKIYWTETNIQKQESLCKEYTGKAATGCWQALGIVYLQIVEDDSGKIFNLCNQAAPSIEDRNQCYFFASWQRGIYIMTQSGNYTNMNNLSTLCEPYYQDAEGLKACVDFLVPEIMRGVPLSLTRFTVFCNDMPESSKTYCYSSIGKQLKKMVDLPQQNQICENVSEEYKNLCLGN